LEEGEGFYVRGFGIDGVCNSWKNWNQQENQSLHFHESIPFSCGRKESKVRIRGRRTRRRKEDEDEDEDKGKGGRMKAETEHRKKWKKESTRRRGCVS
jgi:hypothetical protein